MKKLFISIMALALSLGARAQTQIWVSTGGSDTSDGSQEMPFATLQRAVEHVRKLRSEKTVAELGEIHIILRGGTYRLDKTLTFGTNDCGTAASPTIIESADGEKAILSGGVQVQGWSLAGNVEGLPEVAHGQVWVANTPVKDGSQVRFRQMWVNGQKMRRASTFDDYSMPQIVSVDKNAKTLTIPRPKMDLSKAKHLEMWIPQDWTVNIMRLTSITHKNEYQSVLKFQSKEADIEFKRPWPILRADYGSHSNHRFFLSNAIELLNRPQEWYNDIDDNKLYYWPRSGETMSNVETIVPHLETLVHIEGTLDNPTSYITFRDIAFEHTTWMRPTDEGHVALQAGQWLYDAYSQQTATANNVAWVGRPAAAISVQNASNITFEECRFSHMGSTAVDFVRGTSNTYVRGCLFTDIAGNGVLGGYFGDENFESHVAYNPADKREACDGIYVENNYMVEPANEDWGCHGVGIGFASNVNIRHNEIVDAPYSAISVGWGWIHTSNIMHDNHIDYNHINGFAVYLRDCGALYTLSPQPNSSIRGNWIEKPGDSEVCPLMWDMKEAQFDIYTDEGTDYYTVADNWCSRGSFSKNQNGSHNTWTNNSPNVSQSICDNAGIEPQYRHIMAQYVKPDMAPVDSIGDMVNANIDQVDFVAQNDGFKLGTAVAVDLNNDNLRDIVYSGGESYQVNAGGVRINTGNYGFAATQKLTHAQFGNFAAGDLDGDGNIDLVQAGYDFWDAYNAVLMNDGKGRLETTQLARSNSTSPSCGIADINNDGLPDYFFIGSGKNSFYMQKQNRSGFKRQSLLTLPSGTENPGMIYADLDNNQSIDICLLTSKTGGVYTRVHYNNGKGEFTEKAVGFKEKATRGGMAYADVNGDGWLDVAIGGRVQGEEWNTPASKGGQTISLYLNNGDGTFTLAQEFSEYLQDNMTQPVRFCDWDNDGYSDLIVAGWNISQGNIARVDVYLNDGTGHFTKTDAKLPGASEVSLEVADFTSKGINDILISGNANGAMGFHGYDVDRRLAVLCKNKTEHLNTPPSAPADLNAVVEGNSVRLTWSAGADGETPVKSLSYNYYIRNVETGQYLTFPNSDIATGIRRVTGIGNAFLNLGWTLQNLPVGTYAWSVQAIDAGYAGSVFAEEKTFTIETASPSEKTIREKLEEQGWEKMESLEDMTFDDRYFVLLMPEEEISVMATDALGNKNWGNTIVMTYAEEADPTKNFKGMFVLDAFNETSGQQFIISPLRDQNRHYRTESWNKALWQTYSDVHKSGDSYGVDGNRKLALLTLGNTANGWTMKNVTSDAFLGPWDNGAFEDGAEFAANKSTDNLAYFEIYSIPRVLFMQNTNDLESACDENLIDLTYLITNPSFGRYDENRHPIGWNIEGVGQVEHQGKLSGCEYYAYMNYYQSSGKLSNRSTSQTLRNLPAGTYRLVVRSQSSGTGSYLFAGEEKIDMKHTGSKDVTLDFVLSEPADVNIGVKLENYSTFICRFDNFRLYYTSTSTSTSIMHPSANPMSNDGKRLENGKIVITKDDKKYDTSGVRIY